MYGQFINKKKINAWLAGSGALLAISGTAQAALFDRGGGLIYDDVLNITWLADANYAKTSGYSTDGKMNWVEATTWAADLSYGGYDDWRLARNTPIGQEWDFNWDYHGTTDSGHNIEGTHSELVYMYYVNLGFKSNIDRQGGYVPDNGIFGNGTRGGERNGLGPNGSIINLQSSIYWSGTATSLWYLDYDIAWAFATVNGGQDYLSKENLFYAWAVRDGDVSASPVPEPESIATLLAGLGTHSPPQTLPIVACLKP